MKKIIAVLLSIIMLMSVVSYIPVSVSAIVNRGALTAGDTFTMGSFPQTMETDFDIISKLSNIKGDGGIYFDEREFLSYSIIEMDGNKYMAISFSNDSISSDSDSYIFGNRMVNDGMIRNNRNFYFKYEPIEWVVLDAEKGLVTTSKVLSVSSFVNQDTVYFDNDRYDNDYRTNQKDESF